MKALLIRVPYEGTPVGRDRKASVEFTTQVFVEANSSIIEDLTLGRSDRACKQIKMWCFESTETIYESYNLTGTDQRDF